MTTKTHCTRCMLTSDHPGIEIGAEGLCNLCQMRLPDEIVENYKYTQAIYDTFRAAEPRLSAPYDCLFMYSGGKDSTWMLDRFVNAEGRRVLAYTFNVPFESRFTEENIARVRAAIPIEFVLDEDDDGIRKMMAHVFNRPLPTRPGEYLDEKKPCALCRTFFVLRAILLAWRQGIPYIILCGDPQQIVTMESRVKRIVTDFVRDLGQGLGIELFGEELLELAIAADDELPKIVFPYIAYRHHYDPASMIKELKAKGLYASSPLETHCTLFPLLNYYSFVNYDCSFYKLNMSAQRRAGDDAKATFGIDFQPAGDLLAIEAEYKAVILDIVRGASTEEAQRAALLRVFGQMRIDDAAAEYLTEKYLSLHSVAKDLGVRLR